MKKKFKTKIRICYSWFRQTTKGLETKTRLMYPPNLPVQIVLSNKTYHIALYLHASEPKNMLLYEVFPVEDKRGEMAAFKIFPIKYMRKAQVMGVSSGHKSVQRILIMLIRMSFCFLNCELFFYREIIGVTVLLLFVVNLFK